MMRRIQRQEKGTDRRGFTLVEILVVITLILALAGLLVPTVGHVAEATSLTQATQNLQNELSLARQQAIASNKDVEVRFYRYARSNDPAGEEAIHAIQLFSYNDDGTSVPAGNAVRFSGQAKIEDNPGLSTLAEASREKDWSGETKPEVLDLGTGYDAFAFRFRPDGSTNLPPGDNRWYVTLHVEKTDPGGTLPDNFAVIQIDPVNGRTRLYRP